MIDLISVENMRKSDAYTILNFIPSLELMRRAAQGIFDAYNYPDAYISIVVGSGNNGGDGYALAKILNDSGRDVVIFQVSSKTTDDSKYYMNQCIDSNIPIYPFTPGCLRGSKVIVDCLLGTGFKGIPRDNYKIAIEDINNEKNRGAFIISADINSGLDGDTGEYDVAVKSNLTVTIGYLKKGLIKTDIIDKIAVIDIGIVLLEKEQEIDEKEKEIRTLISL